MRKLRAKKIKFLSEKPELDLLVPEPSSKTVPMWFRELDGVIGGQETIKKCVPFLDSMTAGYTISLPVDVYVENGIIEHNAVFPIVTTHNKSQVSGMAIPKEYNDQPYKWDNSFVTTTPKGYSTFFMHPVNRIDLPFYSLSGVVDTDAFPVAVNFPFFIKQDFTGIIEAGTPIIQAFPFKRDDWEMSSGDVGPLHIPADFSIKRMSPPFNFYKRKYWKRKRYS